MLGRFDDMRIEEPASKGTIDRTLFGISQECFDNISPNLTPNINHPQFVKQYLKKLVLWEFDSFRHDYIEKYRSVLADPLGTMELFWKMKMELLFITISLLQAKITVLIVST